MKVRTLRTHPMMPEDGEIYAGKTRLLPEWDQARRKVGIHARD